MTKAAATSVKIQVFGFRKNFAISAALIFVLLSVFSCSNIPEDNNQSAQRMFTDFERKIAQKMALDIRYFCQDNLIDSKLCRQSVTQLPQELAEIVTEGNIGGVVLFAENLVSNEQIITLTHDLQQAALASKSAKPLIISIDQEGGRVARLPHATSFAGNMAVGATYANAKDKTHHAISSSKVIATELSVLGINNNYAPVIDVNTNSANPVINTRSFGENPQQVAELGVAVVNTLQAQGLMSTLKHFPGHGDTHVDSHLGLPRVDHDLATIEQSDLAPFRWALKHSDPAMIMTAHIQYPALDDSVITTKDGEKTIRPATMSRKIITDLLRKQMAFKGIIATDALDMAGIAHYFDQETAVIETIKAGADLIVMPFKVRVPSDVDKFKLFVKSVSKKLLASIEQGQFSSREIDESLARINHYKEQYIHLPSTTLAEQIALADKTVANEAHLKAQQSLANDATVLVKNNATTLPIAPKKIEHIHVLVADTQSQQALQKAITQQWQKAGQRQLKITSIVAEQEKSFARIQNISQLNEADLVIAAIDIKLVSAVDLGGVDDLVKQAINKHKSGQVAVNTKQANYGQLVQLQLALAKEQGIKSLLIAQGSPFLIAPFLEDVDSALLTFDDRVMADTNGQVFSAGFNASMAIATGQLKVNGVLPVTVN